MLFQKWAGGWGSYWAYSRSWCLLSRMSWCIQISSLSSTRLNPLHLWRKLRSSRPPLILVTRGLTPSAAWMPVQPPTSQLRNSSKTWLSPICQTSSQSFSPCMSIFDFTSSPADASSHLSRDYTCVPSETLRGVCKSPRSSGSYSMLLLRRWTTGIVLIRKRRKHIFKMAELKIVVVGGIRM